MRCYTLSSLALLATVACGTAGKDGDGGARTPTGDTDDGATSGTGTTPAEAEPWKFRVTELALELEADVDGDGDVENNMANALALVDGLMGEADLSVPGFNTLLADSLYPDNLVLFEAVVDGSAVSIGVLYGSADAEGNITIDPDSYEGGVAKDTLTGAFTDGDAFTAGPSTITVPVTLDADQPAVDVRLLNVLLDGNLAEAGTSGSLAAALPITEVVENIIDPLIPPEGYDLNGDGDISDSETKEAIMALVLAIAPGLSDVDLGGGELAISCMFQYTAEPEDFTSGAR